LHMVKDCPHRRKNSVQNIGNNLATTGHTRKPSRVFVNTTATSSRDAQRALRMAELAAQHEQIKLESEKNKLEHSVCGCNLKIEIVLQLMKRYGDALRGTLGRMPTEPTDLPAVLDNAEGLFCNASAAHDRRSSKTTGHQI